MTPSDLRDRIRQLAEDWSWLETQCRNQPNPARHATFLRLAAALTRNVVGPALERVPPKPLHLAVVGGAGAGKSTVVNYLLGAVVAEANAQAGYTRHPTAYVRGSAAETWPNTLGFLGPLKRVDEAIPANRDEDVYQFRRLPEVPGDPLANVVVWDCPDMTTWASGGYANRLTEVAALADIIVYVASDERYNDEVPTQYFHLLVQSGKSIAVVLTKMRETDAPTLAQHFRSEVLGKLPPLPDGQSRPEIPIAFLPALSSFERTDPAEGGRKYRVALLNPILALATEGCRTQTVRNALTFLETAGDGLLDVARNDLGQIDAWKAAVASGRAAFEDRYRREFLAGETFRRFDQTRDQMLNLLDLPGSARTVSTALGFVRWPYRKAREFLAGLIHRPPSLALAERDVLQQALAAWLDGLQAEAIRKSGQHPVWRKAAQGFQDGARTQADEMFRTALRDFETKETIELETAGQSLVEHLTSRPAFLNLLRAVKILADVLIVIFVVYWFWPPSWWIIFVLLLAVSLTHQIAEWAIAAVVESTRARIRGQRTALVSEHFTTPIANLLSGLPLGDGSELARLNQILARVPAAIRELRTAWEKSL
jgi:hypothetical protein